jgi:2-oxo-4-hydroxy-4-carboxy-5-ureidoimidazoline decarboxylase
VTLEELNTMPPPEFVATLGGLFEHSPWVAEGVVSARPFDTAQALLEAMRQVVSRAGPEVQLRLIRAHPKLGNRGPKPQQLTAASTHEQRRAGLEACTPWQYAQLERLNADYFEKFGFPFILAVRGHTPESILEQCAERLERGATSERAAALIQIGLIAGYRLAELLAPPPLPSGPED